MDILKPYGGSSVKRLTDMINKDNTGVIEYDVDFLFGAPLPYSDQEDRNTKVNVIPKPSLVYDEAPIPIRYKRLDLTVLDRLPSDFIRPVVVVAVPFSIHEILAEINLALGLDLTTEEVENVVFSTRLPFYPLRIKENVSLAWVDSNYVFRADHGDHDIFLSDVITNTLLSGFDYEAP